ncbi:branched-chain amino acid ABC transporter permease [Bradyrhizobium japonicum]|jgi:branched-chain amino acid transport system permease protein|uniref:branched-chain amino acid ABC transporter permease n=1 Tax=Bradyrhizobium japonicum TaxID=375 RepID=UPI00209DF26B|nr:branched-chain amino acid ABC transporter permease [Bradyrhizobium japonicum]MCP1768636.1 branched-chain amino acid transport system permease protein [Bradyrhizobium japonicum]MCP1794306.1 branched-chain amino acid transport system permease protein [Bradyrhizobium japonicum]MCP1810938.1 branched-chain amino acid transport system permease protein [Bradyrhizobium japonicum]MCP1821209.1 branched-chain amino acid transport system permease protein [Bradyrhizobium japonicum]MCP1876245.1 branched-
MKHWRIPALIFLLLLCALSRSSYLVSLAVVIGLQALPAIGLALIAGFTGQISLGHAAFYGLGAYGAALIGKWFGVPAWLDILLATAIVSAIAWAIGWLVFRLKGHYLAMATLAFGIIVQVGFVELRDVTGGPNGLTGIAPLALFGHALDGDFVFLPAVWVVTIVTIVCAENLIASPSGLAIRAISESEIVARSVGNDVQSVKRMVMMLSGLCCALGGGLYAHYVGYLSPGPFDVGFSVKLLLMVAIGGFADIWGVLFGVFFITLIGELLKPLGAYDVVAYGLLLVVSVIYCPNGLLRGVSSLVARGVRLTTEGRAS